MSDDEFSILIFAGVIAAMLALRWYRAVLLARERGFALPERIALGIAPLAGLAIIYAVIVMAASGDVRNDPGYVFFYCLVGMVWLLGAGVGLEYLGISYRDDAVERRNPAAAILLVGMVLAHAAIYAGANIGNGPGWWTVVAAAGVGSAAWALLWLVGELLCGLSDDITVCRDVPAALRLAGYALAMGLICARGAAGDWTSLRQTVIEFGVAWPIIPLTAVVIVVEKVLEKQELHYRRGLAASVILAALYLASAGYVVVASGPPPHNPQYDDLNQQ